MAQKLFRKVSLERLSSPEQMDQLLTIVRVPGWIALFCILLLTSLVFIWSIFAVIPTTIEGAGILFNPRAIRLIVGHTDGHVEKIDVKTGDTVQKGMPLVAIRPHDSSKEVSVINAPENGVILEINVILGKDAQMGSSLMWLESSPQPGEKNLVYGFFPINQAAKITEGMKAYIDLKAVNRDKYGKMLGIVERIEPFASSKHGEILQSIPSHQLREFLSNQGASVIVEISPVPDSSTPSGYKWTSSKGPPFTIARGSIGSIDVVVDEKHPISYLFPIGKE